MHRMRTRISYQSLFLILFTSLTAGLVITPFSQATDKASDKKGAHWLTPSQKKSKKDKKKKDPREENQLSEAGDRNFIHYQFPIPDSLKPNYEFWKLIYSTYDSQQVVMHDTEHLEIIYSVLDFKPSETLSPTPLPSKKSRQEEEKTRIREILKRLAVGGYEIKDLNPEEKKIYDLFEKIEDPTKFEAAAEPGRIRGQTGQKDRFIQAIALSGAYLTEIEDVFTEKGLPVELSRLPFVESMFNLKARSKVGASGIWQFMPSTGRLFMQVNGVVDERNDPIICARAAADLLKSNYERLGNWPLAVNAYNAGALSLQRAKDELGTDDIGMIAKQYRGGSYKFASRNFYTEFMAALEVANHYKKYFGEIERAPRIQYETYTFETPLNLAGLLQAAGIEQRALQELNPAYHPSLFYSKKPFPGGYSLRIPLGTKAQLEKAGQEMLVKALETRPGAVAVDQ